jgi:ribonuclease P protein component
MLKKELRIRKQKDFDRIFSNGSFYSEAFLAIKVSKNDFGFSRFAFIVSNKVSKKAHERNRIKRLLRESVRLSLLEIKQGIDIVFIVRTDISGRSIVEVASVVDRLLKKSGLLQK